MIDFVYNYISELWGLTLEMAPYLLFGFLFAGILKVYFPKHLLVRYMGQSNAKAAFNASLLGVPLPLCSCGVLPTGIALFRNGASRGSTNAFLISTPQTGVDSILVTYAMLGLPFAIIRPIVALITGFAGGVLTNTFVKNETKTETSADEENTPRTWRYMLRYAFVEFLQDIAKYLVIGLSIAALIAVILPDDFFVSYGGNRFLQMIIVLMASVPIYFCATGSVPIAAVLLMKGLSPGAALVLLMAGPAVNTASFTVLLKTLGKKTTFFYILTIVSGALIFGTLMNFLPASWFQMLSHHHHHEHGSLLPGSLSIVLGITLIALIINAFIQKYLPKNIHSMSDSAKGVITIQVGGMTCNHCVNNVQNQLKKFESIHEAIADLNTGKVSLKGENISIDEVKQKIEDLGYDFHGIQP
jgi:uncharacterized membrane protein YraQ (UPF0718 family)